MRNRKKHIKLPLSIPQNIIDMFVEYREWRKDQKSYPFDFKNKWIERLTVVCRKWHLFNGWGSIAGSYWIHTNIGVTVYTHIGEDKLLKIQQCNNLDTKYNPWEGQYPMSEKGTVKGQKYVYNWEDYTPLILPD